MGAGIEGKRFNEDTKVGIVVFSFSRLCSRLIVNINTWLVSIRDIIKFSS